MSTIIEYHGAKMTQKHSARAWLIVVRATGQHRLDNEGIISNLLQYQGTAILPLKRGVMRRIFFAVNRWQPSKSK